MASEETKKPIVYGAPELVALDSWIAARSVHWNAVVSQTPSPMFMSGRFAPAPMLTLTLNVVGAASAAGAAASAAATMKPRIVSRRVCTRPPP